MNILKKLSVVLLILFLGYIGFILYNLRSEDHAHSLGLSINIKTNDLCLYTNNKNNFLGEPDDETYFLVWVKSFDFKKNVPISIIDKQVFLKDHIFPFTKEDCILIPLSKFELNTPYAFIIHTEKSFTKRACIIKNKDKYQVREVPSIHNGC